MTGKARVKYTAQFGIALFAIATIAVVAFFLPIDQRTWERLYYISQVLTLVLLLVSGLFVWRQITDSTDQRLNTHFEAVSRSIADMQAEMIKHPDLYPYFYEGADYRELSTADRHRTLLVAEGRLDRLDAILLRFTLFPQPVEESATITVWVKDCFELSPAMRDVIAEHRSWYREELLVLATVTGEAPGRDDPADPEDVSP